MPLMLALMSIFTFFASNGCAYAKREIVYVNDSERIKVIRAGEVAPFDGILITHGRYEQLLDYEGEIQ